MEEAPVTSRPELWASPDDYLDAQRDLSLYGQAFAWLGVDGRLHSNLLDRPEMDEAQIATSVRVWRTNSSCPPSV
jgi:hypothetical protein